MFKLKGGKEDDYIRPHNTPALLIKYSLVIVACRLGEVVNITSIELDKIEGS